VCRHYVATSFSLVTGCAHSWSFCVFFGVGAVNMILSVKKIMLISLDEHFSATVLNG